MSTVSAIKYTIKNNKFARSTHGSYVNVSYVRNICSKIFLLLDKCLSLPNMELKIEVLRSYTSITFEDGNCIDLEILDMICHHNREIIENTKVYKPHMDYYNKDMDVVGDIKIYKPYVISHHSKMKTLMYHGIKIVPYYEWEYIYNKGIAHETYFDIPSKCTADNSILRSFFSIDIKSKVGLTMSDKEFVHIDTYIAIMEKLEDYKAQIKTIKAIEKMHS